MPSPLLSDLRFRELIDDSTNPDELDRHLATGPRTLYCGFDPTADSLHIGSLLPLLALRRFQVAGHRPIVLVGGGTGLIGDPSGKAAERPLNPKDQVARWADRLKAQAAAFLDFDGAHAARVLDNYQWLSKLDVISFLRDIGKEFAVGAMLAKESVRSRVGRADVGLSYTEFSYQVLQSYDFLELFRTQDCTLQIGGSDQWGNITAGIDLIRRQLGATAYGLTLPLITKTDGSKFGKTEAGTVWLDAAKTSPYEMYQFWLNTADVDVVRFLKYFTFLSPAEIESLARETAEAPESRRAQRTLAEEVTRLTHGADELRRAQAISDALFTGEIASLTEPQLVQALQDVPTVTLPLAEVRAKPLADLLVAAGVADSKRMARELVSAGAIQLNGERVKDPGAPAAGSGLFGRYLVIRRGKRSYHLVVLAGGAGS
jgi:tyrosyl-tRNA synthetase